jgi:tRNA(Arg) A34 adenosine deaminase TadA
MKRLIGCRLQVFFSDFNVIPSGIVTRRQNPFGNPHGIVGRRHQGNLAIMDRNEFMRRAIALAEQNVADIGGGPFGAVVVHDGRIVGEGTNLVTGLHDPTAHAEVVAIRAACTELRTFSLAGCEIYASCEPCPMCLSAIYWARIDRIFYGNTKTDAAAIGFDDDHIYREIALPISERAIPTERLLTDEAMAAFRAWENADNKITY